MCLISLKSYRTQFLSILDSLYRTQAALSQEDRSDKKTIEKAINNIVFGVPSPPRRFEYFADYLQPTAGNNTYGPQKPIVEVRLSQNERENIYLLNENPFDVGNRRYENIWVLLQTLSAENVLQLFKRLLFNTCNILVSENPTILNKCI